MKAKMFFLMCVMGILSASVATAQQGSRGGVPAYDVTQDFDMFLGQITLTEKQQADVEKLRKAMNDKIEKANKVKNPNPKTIQNVTNQAMKDFRSKVKEDVLTSEQRKKLKEIEAEAKKQHQPQGNGAKKGR
jgi:Spy/CpxP family protein refolding chaperone